jgi:hypothetical protein
MNTVIASEIEIEIACLAKIEDIEIEFTEKRPYEGRGREEDIREG